jgi:hypothetical protein
MTCIDDRRLLEVHLGDAAPAEHEHLATCAACADRLRALRADLHRIDTVLRETMPPPLRARRQARAWRWAPVAAAVVLAWSSWSTCTWGDPLLGVGCDEPAVMQIAWQ